METAAAVDHGAGAAPKALGAGGAAGFAAAADTAAGTGAGPGVTTALGTDDFRAGGGTAAAALGAGGAPNVLGALVVGPAFAADIRLPNGGGFAAIVGIADGVGFGFGFADFFAP